MKHSWKYILLLLFLTMIIACEEEADKISKLEFSIQKNDKELSKPYTADVGEELTFIVDGDADYYSVWPGSPLHDYKNYGAVDSLGQVSAGVALSKNIDLYTGTFTYNEAGTFDIVIIGRNFTHKATDMQEKILNESIIVNDTIP